MLSSASIAQNVDNIFFYIVGISIVLLLGITAVMVLFVVKYRREKHPRAEEVAGSTWLEVTWTVLPTLLVLTMFYYGYEGFYLMRHVPKDALTVKVTARMWDWSFEYPGGLKTDRLYVPVDKPVKLLLTSLDVTHSFFLPAFRVKEDAVPGRQSYLWFKPQTTGPADIFCAEYCGQRHSYMMSQVIVMEQEAFARWYASQGKIETPEARALALLEKHSCLQCHTISPLKTGLIPLRGILGRRTTVVAQGQKKELIADPAYLRRSITDPGAELLEGYPDSMPASAGMSSEELEEMVTYLEGLR